MSNTTNDPRAEYKSVRSKFYLDTSAAGQRDPQEPHKKREPMLSDDLMRNWKTEPSTDAGWKRYVPAMAHEVRDHYEALVADGTLIRRDELVAFLNERLLDEEKGVRWDLHNNGSAVTVVQNIIDHLNKKP